MILNLSFHQPGSQRSGSLGGLAHVSRQQEPLHPQLLPNQSGSVLQTVPTSHRCPPLRHAPRMPATPPTDTHVLLLRALVVLRDHATHNNATEGRHLSEHQIQHGATDIVPVNVVTWHTRSAPGRGREQANNNATTP